MGGICSNIREICGPLCDVLECCGFCDSTDCVNWRECTWCGLCDCDADGCRVCDCGHWNCLCCMCLCENPCTGDKGSCNCETDACGKCSCCDDLEGCTCTFLRNCCTGQFCGSEDSASPGTVCSQFCCCCGGSGVHPPGVCVCCFSTPGHSTSVSPSISSTSQTVVTQQPL